MSEWQPIETAPPLERIFAAGWQPQSGRVAGYWWVHEDYTDEKGVPMEYPTALKWQHLPAAPKSPPSVE